MCSPRDNGMAYFSGSNKGIRGSVVKRFNNEKLDALKSLELEITNKSTPVQNDSQGEVIFPVDIA